MLSARCMHDLPRNTDNKPNIMARSISQLIANAILDHPEALQYLSIAHGCAPSVYQLGAPIIPVSFNIFKVYFLCLMKIPFLDM